MIDATNRKTNNTQNEVTEQLGGRVQDISYWKFEVERTIQDITSKCIHIPIPSIIVTLSGTVSRNCYFDMED